MQQLLIDGHNLIGQMPDLSLADPDDEQQLVRLLRQYAARRSARVIVVFDSGLPGGRSNELSGGGVTAIFAGSHTNADRVLMARIRELKKPGEWIVVSSDREVQLAAARRHLIVWSAQDFLKRLMPSPSKDKTTSVEPPVSQKDVDEWLRIFGDVPQTNLPAPSPSPTPKKPRPAGGLSEDDLNEWLAIFGDIPQTKSPAPPPSQPPPALPTSAPARRKKRPAEGTLSPEEVEEWLKIFDKKS